MPTNREDADLAGTAISLIVGASESITLKARYCDGREFGLQLEDLAYSVDGRLSLRCLLPLPGLHRDRDGTVCHDENAEGLGLDSLKQSLAVLEDAGWECRLIAGLPLASSLIADRDAGIYYAYLNDPPGPFFSGNRPDVAHYAGQFEVAWQDSFPVSAAETLYDETKSLVRPAEASHITLVSREAWSELIVRLSKNPHLVREIRPRKFEELVAELLSRDGLEVHLTPETRDGGRDVLAFHQTPVGRLLYLVECKRYRAGRPVGIAIVQRLYGVVSQERASAGLVVTTSHFSKDALTFADTVRHQLGLRDYEALKQWLVKHGNG